MIALPLKTAIALTIADSCFAGDPIY